MNNESEPLGETIEDIEVLSVDEPSSFGSIADSIGTKSLMIAIVTMPLVFIVVVMGILAVFGKPGETPAATQSAVRSVAIDQPVSDSVSNGPSNQLIEPALASIPGQSPSLAPSLGQAQSVGGPIPGLLAPEDSDVKTMALDGNRLAVWYENDEGRAVIVYDLTTGAIIKTAPIITEAGR